MGITLDREWIERGYHSDETGRWVDASYLIYVSEISGARELKHLERILQKFVKYVETKITTESSVLETQFAAAVASNASALQKYNELHWFERLFTRKPFTPTREDCDAFWSRRKLTATIERLKLKIDSLQSLNLEFGVYECWAEDDVPIEYEMLMTREDRMNFDELLQGV